MTEERAAEIILRKLGHGAEMEVSDEEIIELLVMSADAGVAGILLSREIINKLVIPIPCADRRRDILVSHGFKRVTEAFEPIITKVFEKDG